jgi:hypothetical protein
VVSAGGTRDEGRSCIQPAVEVIESSIAYVEVISRSKNDSFYPESGGQKEQLLLYFPKLFF